MTPDPVSFSRTIPCGDLSTDEENRWPVHTESWPVSRTGWFPGPWDSEPDRVQWISDEASLVCMIMRNTMGSLCGYVAVPPDHPWRDGNDEPDVSVHGGITFITKPDDSLYAIDIQSDPKTDVLTALRGGLMWIGFDCAHSGDLSPGVRSILVQRGILTEEQEVYRDITYVRAEVENLAAAARAVWQP